MHRRSRQDASNIPEPAFELHGVRRVKVDQQKKQYDFQIKGAKVFATCNEINRLSKPLQSRFRKLFLPRYTEEQFLKVSEKVLPKPVRALLGISAHRVWKMEGDIRDVISMEVC